MRKILCALMGTMMVISLAGCSPVSTLLQSNSGSDSSDNGSSNVIAAEDGYAEGRMGDVMKTCFFNYTVNSAYTCDEYSGYTPQDGYKLLVAEVTVKNTDRETITMFDTDFQVQWGDDDNDDAYDCPITYYMNDEVVNSEQLPGTYELEVNEERTGMLVFEVPEDTKDYSISYLEIFSDDSEGDMFFVYFTAKDKTL